MLNLQTESLSFKSVAESVKKGKKIVTSFSGN